MSLGGSAYEPLDLEVIEMGAKGIFVALAAGNESDDANNHSPARANGLNVYTISACDVNDNLGFIFQTYGNPPIDYCAPGVSILSTYNSRWTCHHERHLNGSPARLRRAAGNRRQPHVWDM